MKLSLAAILLTASAALLLVITTDINDINYWAVYHTEPTETPPIISYTREQFNQPCVGSDPTNLSGCIEYIRLQWFTNMHYFDVQRYNYPDVLHEVNGPTKITESICELQRDYFLCQAKYFCSAKCSANKLAEKFEADARHFLQRQWTNPACARARRHFSFNYSYCEYVNYTRMWKPRRGVETDAPSMEDKFPEVTTTQETTTKYLETTTTTTQETTTEDLETTTTTQETTTKDLETTTTSDYNELYHQKKSAPIEPKRSSSSATEYWCIIGLLSVLFAIAFGVIIGEFIIKVRQLIRKNRAQDEDEHEEFPMVDLSSDRV